MKIYNYHRDTGEFINESIANESPLEPGVYLIPANATQIKPPAVGANEAAVFADGWQIVPDFRGDDAWDFNTRKKVEIIEIGKTLEEMGLVNYEPEPTQEEIQLKIKRDMTNFVQSILDCEAQKYNYDNIVSATSYAGYVNQFQAEGIAFGVWRSAVWAKGYEIMNDVLNGTRQVPTEEQLLAELPKLTL